MPRKEALLAGTPWRAEIPPLDLVERPVWSVMIPTYNCAHWTSATLESVLAQDEGPDRMQIEVVDDASSDAIRDVVAEVGGGRVTFHRQPENVGQSRNTSTCIQRARGHLVHILHGDDTVRPGFYATMARPFEAHPELGAAFCGMIITDAEGRWDHIVPRVEDQPGILANWLETLAVYNRAPPSATVVRRSAYERLGGFDERLGAPDWEMWMRVAAFYEVWYEPEPLLLYRHHEGAVSGGPRPTGAHIADRRRIIDANRALLPPGRESELTARALEYAAIGALRRGHLALRRGDVASWREHWAEAFRTSHSTAVVQEAAFDGLRGLRLLVLRALGRR
jgi:glycosyltransferase involved in cell wall biosynthesis